MMAGVRLVKSTIEHLKESDSASITFVGSMASKFHFGSPPNSYGPAKAAMRVYAMIWPSTMEKMVFVLTLFPPVLFGSRTDRGI